MEDFKDTYSIDADWAKKVVSEFDTAATFGVDSEYLREQRLGFRILTYRYSHVGFRIVREEKEFTTNTPSWPRKQDKIAINALSTRKTVAIVVRYYNEEHVEADLEIDINENCEEGCISKAVVNKVRKKIARIALAAAKTMETRKKEREKKDEEGAKRMSEAAVLGIFKNKPKKHKKK